MSGAAQDEPETTLVVGFGSPHGDDRLGWLVVERLEQLLRGLTSDGRPPTSVELRRATTPSDLLDWLPGPTRLILIDACEGPAEEFSPNGWRRFDTLESFAAVTRASVGHLIGLPAVLALARQLERLPPQMALWAIRGEQFAAGMMCGVESLSRAAELARQLADSFRSPRPSRSERAGSDG